MRAALRAAVCAACLAAPSLATAAPQRVATVSGLRGDMQFAGPRVAWLEQTDDSWAVRSAVPGESPALLAGGALVPTRTEGGDGGSTSFETVGFATSDRRIAIVDLFANGSSKYMTYVWRGNLLTAPLGQPLASVESCSGANTPIRDLTLDGDVLAYGRCRSGIGIRDYGPGAAAPKGTFDYQSPGPPRVAGRYLAVQHYVPDRSVEEVVLLDWTTGAELLRVGDPTFAFVGDYDATPDGKLVVLRVMGPLAESGPCFSPMRIVLYTPPSTAEQTLPAQPCFFDIAEAGGRVAFVSQSGPDRLALSTVSLGGASREIADLGHPQMRTGRIAFDGERAAYALTTCDGRAQISVATVGDTPEPESMRCPLAVRRRARIRRGRATVRLRCPEGCSGSAQLLRRPRRRAREIGQIRSFAFAPSARERSLRLPLSRRARRLLARERRLRAGLDIMSSERGRPHEVVRRLLIVRRHP